MKRDAATGILLALVGLAAAAVARDYPQGTTARPGPGALPLVFALVQVAIGVALLARAWWSSARAAIPAVHRRAFGLHRRALGLHRRTYGATAWRAMLSVLGALATFALLLPRMGFIVACGVLVLIAGLGLPGVRPWPLVMLAVGSAVASYLLFVGVLGVQAPVWPRF